MADYRWYATMAAGEYRQLTLTLTLSWTLITILTLTQHTNIWQLLHKNFAIYANPQLEIDVQQIMTYFKDVNGFLLFACH